MHSILANAIERLYHAFDRPAPRSVEGCDCCMSPAERDALLAKPLRELSAPELESYAFSAVLTVGDGDDLRYFWPRLVELALEGELVTDREIVFAQPVYAEWRARWSAAEQEAVEGLAHAIVEWMAEEELEPVDVDEWICALGRLGGDVTRYLDPLLTPTTAAATNLRGFYEWNARDLRRGELWNAFWEKEPGAAHLVAWFGRPDVGAAIDRAYVLAPGPSERESLS